MRPDLDQLFVRYFLGGLTAVDRRALDDWLAETPDNKAQLERLRAIWIASGESRDLGPAPARVASALQRVKTRSRQGTVVRSLPVRDARRDQWHGRSAAWRIAAVLIVVAGIGVLWRATSTRQALPTQPKSPHVYATEKGERAKITLADGSVVQLGVETSLEIPPDFGRARRELSLRGEAYFEVAHDASRPFRVRAASAVTEVLGTKFDVRARENAVVQVTVADGKVRVNVEGKGPVSHVLLVRGDQAEISVDGHLAVRHATDVGRALSWLDGRLVFRRAPLPDVLTELSRWYDRQFVIRDSALMSLHLTTQLTATSLAETVAVLETALDVRIRVDERSVTLERRGARESAPPSPNSRRRP